MRRNVFLFFSSLYMIHHINNYKILYVPIKETNILYVQSFIISGRMNETSSNSGISHLLEHVLTESWKKCKDDCAKYWGKKGIITNASTGDTTINYYIEGLEKNYKELIEYIIKITTSPVFNQSRIEIEKKAVREELKREMNDDNWKITNKISKLIYNHSGLQNGNNLRLQINNLKKLNKKQLIKYINEVYNPKNILFVVSGDIPKLKILNVFKKFLPQNAVIRKQNLTPNVLTKIKSPKQIFIKNSKAKVAEIVFTFFVNIFPWDPNVFLFGLIRDILCGGMQGLLMRKLRTELHLIYNIQVYLESEILGTLVTIETTGAHQNVSKIITETTNVLRNLINGNWDNSHMNRIKDRYLIKDEKLCKSNIFIGNFYGEQYMNQLYKKKPKIYSLKQRKQIIQNATKTDIIQISKKIFPLNKMIIVYQSKIKA